MPATITRLRWGRCSPPEVKGAGAEHQEHRRQERSHAVDGLRGLSGAWRSVGVLRGTAVVCGSTSRAGDLAARGLAGVLRDRWRCYISVAVVLVLPRTRPMETQGQNR